MRHDYFVPLHCQQKRRNERAGQQILVLKPNKIYSLPRAQNFSCKWRQETNKTQETKIKLTNHVL